MKDNAFVNNARYRLSVREQRVILTLISLINPGDKKFKTYTVDISRLYELLGLKKESVVVKRKILKKTLAGLKKHVLEIVTDKNPDYPGREVLMLASWIQDPVFDWQKNVVDLRISELLRPYLLDLKKKGYYISFSLPEADKLKCVYSLRFLEFCRVHNPRAGYHDDVIDGRYVIVRVYELSDLRKALAIPPGVYPKITNFRQRILEPARSEVNAHTKARFDFEMVKQGRVVSGVKIIIYGKRVSDDRRLESEHPGGSLVDDHHGEPGQKLRLEMSAMGVPADFQDLIFNSKYDSNQIRIALEAVKEFRINLEKRGSTLKYPRHAFEKALLDGWISSRETERRREELKKAEREDDLRAAEVLRRGLKEREEREEAELLAEHQRRMAEYQEKLKLERAEFNRSEQKTDYIMSTINEYDTVTFDNWEFLRGVVDVLIIEGADFDVIKNAAMRELLGFQLGVC
jgi:plasmid replication initiation protein